MESINQDHVDWEFVKKLGFSVWLKDLTKLKTLLDLVAKTHFRRAAADLECTSKASVTFLWYILTG